MRLLHRQERDVAFTRAQRLAGATAAALATLLELERLHPRFSRLHEERGLCHVALRQAPEAIGALLEAVRINPALPARWSMLEGLYRMTGQPENAVAAAAHVPTLKQLPPEVVAATDAKNDAAASLVTHCVGCNAEKYAGGRERARPRTT